MGRIVILDEQTANQIAAGEVVEGPASVVKEMVENAVDAGATQISVEIRNGGIRSIRVSDNGSGLEPDDVEMAFERHATSKIRRLEDLDGITSMGFRGEALASIASISRMELVTRTSGMQTGTKVMVEGGRILSVDTAGCPVGTVFHVRDLFFNTPARYKFLKKDATEGARVADVMERLALAHPDVSLRLLSNGESVMHTPGNGELSSVIYSLYGRETAEAMLALSHMHEGIAVTGFVGLPAIARGNRARQSILMNGRHIRSGTVQAAVDEAFKTLLMTRRFAFSVVVLDIPPMRVDVNVHPAKLEVRFSEERLVFSAVHSAVRNALNAGANSGELAPIQQLGSKQSDRPDATKPDESFSSGPVPVSPTDQQQLNPNPQRWVAEPTYHQEMATVSEQGHVFLQTTPQMPARPLQHNSCVSIAVTAETVLEPLRSNDTETVAASPEPVENPPGSDSIRHPAFLQMQVIGQVFDSFLVMQHGDEMLLLDQHAAHERMRFETLKRGAETGEVVSQAFLQPLMIHLSASEYEEALHSLEPLRGVGFDVEPFGGGTMMVRAIPAAFDGGLSEAELASILSDWPAEASRRQGVISDEALHLISCKGAIKANRSMDKVEMKVLLEQMARLENPYTCVHGRPILIRFPRRELEKRFKRIV